MLKLKKVTKDATWRGLLSYKDQIKKLKDPADVENAVLNGLCYSTFKCITIQFIEGFNAI